LNKSEAIQPILEKKVVACRKNFIILKQNTYPSPKNASSTVPNDLKTSEIPPVAFIGGLCKTNSVMCSKLVEVHAKNVN